MDAKGEQSHHGDEVMSLLCYKRRRRQQVNARKKKGDRITGRLYTCPLLLFKTSIFRSLVTHLLNYGFLFTCFHVICVKCVYNCNYSWQKAQTVTAC